MGYYAFIVITLITVSCTVMFCGFKLHNNLKNFEKSHPIVKKRLQMVNSLIFPSYLIFKLKKKKKKKLQHLSLTLLSTVFSCSTVLAIILTVFFELFLFHFVNMFSFLTEQFIFRLMEINLSFLILFYLGKEIKIVNSYQGQHQHSIIEVQTIGLRRSISPQSLNSNNNNFNNNSNSPKKNNINNITNNITNNNITNNNNNTILPKPSESDPLLQS